MQILLPLIELSKEIKPFINVHPNQPNVFCKVFEDNKSRIAVAESQKIPLCTKHIAIKYHHFRSHVNKTVKLIHISTEGQIADVLTKTLKGQQFVKLRKLLCGW